MLLLPNTNIQIFKRILCLLTLSVRTQTLYKITANVSIMSKEGQVQGTETHSAKPNIILKFCSINRTLHFT